MVKKDKDDKKPVKDNKEVKEAAALRYSPEKNAAPKLVAAGKGEIAQKIIETAEKNDVPVYEDANLARTLNRLQLGDEIPPELYEVVAEVLVFVSTLDKSFGEKYGIARGKK